MKRVRMRSNYAGPAGSCSAGGEINLPDAEAKGLIEGGYATEIAAAVKPAPKARKPKAKAETATAEPAVERADAPPARRRKPKPEGGADESLPES